MQERQRGDSEKCSNQNNQAKGTGQLLTQHRERGAAPREQVMVITGLEGDQEPRRLRRAGSGWSRAGQPEGDVHMPDCLRAEAEMSACN